ncbi:lysosome-associated membrane glycoprotein 3 [Scleropages formosus]|uniref:lysosome-associated membrane glycoprotein 3 n=1 Tax=Scleropages formosus TaxID=113540 RepID=UPI000878D46B|nr:lysosome-associated membrane glycoprotein 3 [Scleropages formosus]
MNKAVMKVKLQAAVLVWILLLLGSGRAALTALAETHSDASAAATDGASSKDSPVRYPSLVPKESAPQMGSYSLADPKGNVCLKASMAVEFVVTKAKKTLYYNIDPFSIKPMGFCGKNTSDLSLTFNGGNVDFTFLKEGNVSYASKIEVTLQATADCKGCQSEQFTGVLSNSKLFRAEDGLSYKCNSKKTLQMAENLKIKITKLRIQAFNIINGQFGNEVECWPDCIKRLVPLILGSVAVGICLLAIVAYLMVREHRTQGYERI